MKDEVIFERHGENAEFGDGTKAKIPEGMSILALVGANSVIANGDEFRDDGFVWNDGKPYRKWFTPVDGVNVWMPAMQDLVKLEARRWNACQLYRKLMAKHYAPLFGEMKKAKQAYTKITSEDGSEWWVRYFWDDYGGSEEDGGIATECIEKFGSYSGPVNIELGDRWHRQSGWIADCARRAGMFTRVLVKMVWRKYLDVARKHAGRWETVSTYQWTANGRTYWFEHEWHGGKFRCMSYPEDQRLIIEEGKHDEAANE